MEYIIGYGVAAMAVLYAVIIFGCVRQSEW